MLRISRGCDRGESVPVGPSGVEQDSEPVVAEAAEPEPGALDGLDQVVHRFGRAVGDLGAVPRNDLGAPTPQGPPELSEFGGHVAVEEALDEVGQVARSLVGGQVIEAAQRLLSVNRP